MTNQQDTALLPVGQIKRALELWFFRELSDEQRRSLFRLAYGDRYASEATMHHHQRLSLRRVLRDIAAEQAKPSASCEAGEVVEQAEGAAQWLDLMADRFEGEWPNTAKHCRLHVNSLRAAIAALSERGAVGEEVAIPRALFDFLMGCGEIDGSSFSDLHESLPGRFWWRALLRTCDRAALSSIRSGAGANSSGLADTPAEKG